MSSPPSPASLTPCRPAAGGGNSAASSSWSPTDRADSGDMLPLDLRDEVVSPPTTFAEANAEGGIPSVPPPPGPQSVVSVPQGFQAEVRV